MLTLDCVYFPREVEPITMDVHQPTTPGSDSYRTVARYAGHEIKVEGSRFVGRVRAVSTHAEIGGFLADIQRTFHDATHHCFAYRLGCGAQMSVRFSDAGEPPGTAGRPLLVALEARQLTNTIVVVTRYFGGVKLGTGGLARAYGRCAAETLDRAGVVERFLTTSFAVTFPYPLQHAVLQVIRQVQGEVQASDFRDVATLLVAVRQGLVEQFLKRLADATSGKAVVKPA